MSNLDLFDNFFLADMTDSQTRKCSKCKHFLPDWEIHDRCYNCVRLQDFCGGSFSCSICVDSLPSIRAARDRSLMERITATLAITQTAAMQEMDPTSKPALRLQAKIALLQGKIARVSSAVSPENIENKSDHAFQLSSNFRNSPVDRRFKPQLPVSKNLKLNYSDKSRVNQNFYFSDVAVPSPKGGGTRTSGACKTMPPDPATGRSSCTSGVAVPSPRGGGTRSPETCQTVSQTGLGVMGPEIIWSDRLDLRGSDLTRHGRSDGSVSAGLGPGIGSGSGQGTKFQAPASELTGAASHPAGYSGCRTGVLPTAPRGPVNGVDRDREAGSPATVPVPTASGFNPTAQGTATVTTVADLCSPMPRVPGEPTEESCLMPPLGTPSSTESSVVTVAPCLSDALLYYHNRVSVDDSVQGSFPWAPASVQLPANLFSVRDIYRSMTALPGVELHGVDTAHGDIRFSRKKFWDQVSLTDSNLFCIGEQYDARNYFGLVRNDLVDFRISRNVDRLINICFLLQDEPDEEEIASSHGDASNILPASIHPAAKTTVVTVDLAQDMMKSLGDHLERRFTDKLSELLSSLGSQPPLDDFTAQPTVSDAESGDLDVGVDPIGPDQATTSKLTFPRKRSHQEAVDPEDPDEDMSFTETVLLTREWLRDTLPKEPTQPTKSRTSFMGQRSSQDPSTSSLPLYSGFRVEMDRRRTESLDQKVLKKPKVPFKCYHVSSGDLHDKASKVAEKFQDEVKSKPTQITVPIASFNEMNAALRTAVLTSSYSDWNSEAIFQVLAEARKLTDTHDLSPVQFSQRVDELAGLMDTAGSLLQTGARAAEHRMGMLSFLLWNQEIVLRDAWLKALKFTPSAEVLRELKFAPMIPVTDPEVIPPHANELFAGKEELLPKAKEATFNEKMHEATLKVLQKSVHKPKTNPKPTRGNFKGSGRGKFPHKSPFQPAPGQGSGRGRGGPNRGKFSQPKHRPGAGSGAGPKGESAVLSVGRSQVGSHDSRESSRGSLNKFLASLERPGSQSLDRFHPEEGLCFQIQEHAEANSSGFSVQNTFRSRESSSARSRDFQYDRQGCRRTSEPGDSRLLQSPFRCPQEERFLEACHRPLSTEQIYRLPDLCHGDGRIDQALPPTKLVGGVYRSKGRLFPHPDGKIGAEVPQICLQGPGVAIQSPSVRSLPCSVDFLHGVQGGAGTSPSAGILPASISGRLGHKTRVKGGVDRPTLSRPGNLSRLWLHRKRGQVQSRTFARLHLLGLQVRDNARSSVPDSREATQNKERTLSVPRGSRPSCSSVAVDAGPLGSDGKTGSVGSPPHQGITVGPSIPMVQRHRPAVGPDSVVSGRSCPDLLVAEREQPDSGVTVPTTSPFQTHVYGRKSRRLGCAPRSGRRRPCLRPLGARVQALAHKQPGTPSSVLSPSVLGVSLQGSSGFVVDRQYNSGGICQQTGWDQVPLPVQTGRRSVGMVPCSGDSPNRKTYPGSFECSGRSAVQEGSDPSARVVSQPQNFCTIVPNVGRTASGLVRDSLEPQTAGVRFSDSGPARSISRCHDDELGGCLRLRLSSDSTIVQGDSKVQVTSGQDDPNSSRLPTQRLVSGATGSVSGSSKVLAGPVGSPEATQDSGLPSETRVSGPSRLAIVERSLGKKGFSQEVSLRIARPNRESSLGVYQSKWDVFSAWCRVRKTDPLEASAALIADFLLEKHNQGRAPTTLAGYRTAIAKTIKSHRNVDFGANADLSALLRNFQVERPVSRNPSPDWDLALVLNRLASDPFEPLEKAPLKLLTWKTVFLLALASGRRRSELHALAFDRILWKDYFSSMLLGVIPSFLAKTQLASSPALTMEIPALTSSLGPNLQEDAKNCPVRAVRLYMKRTTHLRKNRKLLFIPYAPNSAKEISVASISFWIKKCVLFCYELSQNPTSSAFRVKAHDVRALAASLAFVNRVPLQSIMNTCSWMSHNTFTSFYLRDLAWTSGAGFRLGQVVASANVLNCPL